ncbi:thioredoxin [Kallotenue papyrolyticum]|uniref:thioredoxin n=1 Tax=Kallotenue papyrolyticum TaxID=1325125 RepID=UPI0004922D63|nr:thioredoxin [Kallotenue papyrolyticum]
MVFDAPIHTNEQSIDRVLRVSMPVLLVFWRQDCPPCQELNPRLDQLARAYAGKALIAKVDVRDNPALAQRYNVARLPTLVLVRDGQSIAQAVGAASETALRAWLDAAIKGQSAPAPAGPSVPLQGTAPAGPPPRPQPAAAARPQPTAGQRTGVIELTTASFDQVIRDSGKPVLVDFWAPWCGPCRMVAPVVEQLAREFAGRAVVAKLNIDEHPQIAQRYGIMSIPALYVFRNGAVVEQLVGAQPAAVIRQALTKHVAS